MKQNSLPRARKTIAALAGSAALLLGGFSPAVHAVDTTWTGLGFVVPVWDNVVPANWSNFANPTLADNAIFPAVAPVPFGTTFFPLFNFTRLDGSEIHISDIGLGVPSANSLTFLGDYLFRVPSFVPAGGIPSPLLLNGGNVTVADGKTAIFDITVNVLSGRLTKLGTGTLLIGSGQVHPSVGIPLINASVLVQEGVFGGSGAITGNLINQAIVAPGNSAGTLTVHGDYRQTNRGTLRIEVASADIYDRLQIGGKAELDGSLAVSLLNGYRPGKGRKFGILSANEVDGRFDEVHAPVWKNLTLRPLYEDDRVFLKVVVASFEGAAKTPNQRAAGRALDEVIFDERADKLLRHLYKRDLDDLPGDLDRIAPEELTSLFTISTSLAVVQATNLQRRTDDIRHGSRGFSASGLAMQGSGPGYSGMLAAAQPQLQLGAAGPSGKETKEVKEVLPPEEKKWGAFLTGVGEWVDVNRDGNARGYDITTGGFTLGLDYKVNPNFALGIAAGYAGTGAHLTDDGRVWVNGGKAGLYATYFTGGFYLDTAVSGGYNSYDTKRSAIQGTARGETQGGELNVLAGAGYDWKIGSLTIGPTATFQYTLVSVDGFTEQGSLAPLAIEGRNEESVRTTLGFKMTADRQMGGVILRPEMRAAWQHEYGATTYDLNSSFANGAAGNFQVRGPEVGRDSLIFGAGVAVLFSETFSTYVYYDGEFFRDNYNRHGVSGGFRIAF